MPLLSLLYYHKADVTMQPFALCRQNDVLHDAYQFNGRESHMVLLSVRTVADERKTSPIPSPITVGRRRARLLFIISL